MALNDIIVRCNSSNQNIYEYEESEYSEDLEMVNNEYELDRLIYNKNKKSKLWTDNFDIEDSILDHFNIQEDFSFDRINIKSKNKTSCSKYKPKLIFKLCIEDKYPFYGYYSKPRRMIKVQVYNYRNILQLASELSKRPIEFNGICFECFEVHIPLKSPLPKKIRSLDPPHNQWKKEIILNSIDHLRCIEDHARKIITNKLFPIFFTEYSHYFDIKNKRSVDWDNSVELEADTSVSDILNPFIYSQLNNRGYITPKCIQNIEDNIENWYPRLIPCLNKYWREVSNDPITQHITRLQNFQDNRKPNSNLDQRSEDYKNQLIQTITSGIDIILNRCKTINKSKYRGLLEFLRSRYPNYKNTRINFERQEARDENSDRPTCQLETDKTPQELYVYLPPTSIQTPPIEETILEYFNTEYDLSNNNKSSEECHPNDILQYNNSFKYVIGAQSTLFYKDTENKGIVYSQELEIIDVDSQETIDNACLFPTLEPAAFLDPIDFIYPRSNKLTSLESVFLFKGTFVYKIAPSTTSEVLASLGLDKSIISKYELFEKSPTKEISNEIENISNLEKYNSEDLDEIKHRDSYDIVEPVSRYSDVIVDTPINYNRSNPLDDSIIALAYILRSKKYNEEIVSGLIIVDKETTVKYSDPTNSINLINHSLLRMNTEIELINAIVKLFHYYDPHIVLALDNNIYGRRKSNSFKLQFNKPERRINGRILLYIDRIIRLEYNTLDTKIYSIIKLILNNIIQNINPPVLAMWWKYTLPNCDTRYFNSGKQESSSIAYKSFRYKVVSYIFKKLNMLYEILDKLGTIPKYIEWSQLYGLDFLSIQTHGSQYRVESILLKACERHNFVLFSPTKE
ncbi:uncharacterized protein CMU_021570 [Cryptosporidium muris RN66]|uniref:Uncharacterized protein n=1 Tax=Cryptosporidium muris (strain RN66) TaxID=441375 RepID=B6AJK2_CRYMR|nr:uncharacterized protein CMU_021570 [Cryptosporidium muris RN66]EEA08393.1 hypothetical protein, conserved [Cryptosporidium muris RN66]|eukprot:XP_002142742.1 hypothetical protein [Cryptosporidium muris RN66]